MWFPLPWWFWVIIFPLAVLYAVISYPFRWVYRKVTTKKQTPGVYKINSIKIVQRKSKEDAQ